MIQMLQRPVLLRSIIRWSIALSATNKVVSVVFSIKANYILIKFLLRFAFDYRNSIEINHFHTDFCSEGTLSIIAKISSLKRKTIYFWELCTYFVQFQDLIYLFNKYIILSNKFFYSDRYGFVKVLLIFMFIDIYIYTYLIE